MRFQGYPFKLLSTLVCIFSSLILFNPIQVSSSAISADVPQVPDDLTSMAWSVNYVATSPALPGVMFANATGMLPRYSLDGGVHWIEVATGSGFPVGELASVVALAPRVNDPQNPVRLLIGVSGSDPAKVGLYRSGDFGNTWAMMTFPHPSACTSLDSITSLTASPADPTRVYFNKYCEYYDGEFWEPYGAGYTSSNSGLFFTHIITDGVGVLQPSPVLALRVYDNDGRLVSDNAGASWIDTGLPPYFPYSTKNTFVQDSQNAEKLYVNGYYTNDSGASWFAWESHPCPSSYLQLIADPAISGTLYLRCDEGLFRSQNEGNDWMKLSDWHGNWIGPDYSTTPFRILWARNDGLWISSDHGEHWLHLTDSYSSSIITSWKNVSLPDPQWSTGELAALSSNNVWALSAERIFQTSEPHVLHWNGQEWERADVPITGGLHGIAFDGPNNGWIVGDELAVHWDGTSWKSEAISGDAYINKVDLAGSYAWAVGNGGVILKAEGLNWSVETSPTTLDLYTVAIVSQDEVWSGGGFYDDLSNKCDGIILQKKAGVWSIVETSDKYVITDISAVSSDNIWAVSTYCGQSTILHSDGNDWQETQTVDHLLLSISMISSNDGWIVGNDVLLHWDGSNWNEVGSLGSGCCSAASAAANPGDVWFTLMGWGSAPSPIFRYLIGEERTFLPVIGH